VSGVTLAFLGVDTKRLMLLRAGRLREIGLLHHSPCVSPALTKLYIESLLEHPFEKSLEKPANETQASNCKDSIEGSHVNDCRTMTKFCVWVFS
jgi:hypothetical protein